MPYEVRTSAFHLDVIEWLQDNVGDLLWSSVNSVEWKGRGWTMNSLGIIHYEFDYRYLIRIDDAELSVMCALRWS